MLSRAQQQLWLVVVGAVLLVGPISLASAFSSSSSTPPRRSLVPSSLHQQQASQSQQQHDVFMTNFRMACPIRRRRTALIQMTPNNNNKDDPPSSSSDVPLPDHNNNHHHHHMNDSTSNSSNNKNNHNASPEEEEDDAENHTPAFAKKLRIAKAKADIDRMLSGPDPPFDLQTELEKVVSMNPPPTTTETTMMDPEDVALAQLEDRIQLMEHDLYDAVKRQDFTTADAIQQQLGQDHLDDCAAVLQVNSAFYRAFSEKNLEKMKQVWTKADGSAICIHPSHKPMVGKKAIFHGWKRMFDATEGSFQRNWMEPNAIRISVRGGTAIVTCDEHVYARRFIRGRKRQTELINQLTATNIFRKVAGNWTMVYHHASWHADSVASKAALKGIMSNGNAGTILVRDQKGGRMMNNNNRGHHHQHRGDNDDHSLGPDGILGIANFGPLLGGGGPEPKSKRGMNSNHDASSSPQQQRPPPSKRIIMGGISGRLSDILNESLGDLLSSSTGDGADGTDYIQFRLDDDDDDDDDEDDDDDDLDEDDDEDDDDDDLDDEVEELDVTIIKGGWDRGGAAPNSKRDKDHHHKEKDHHKDGTTTASTNSAVVPKDALRQNCISALRKLCHQGSISPKQKRVLLTDIIACSAKGEFSMVEVAYELLCGEGEDKDAAEEEFADQCRVFATSLSPPDNNTPISRTTSTTTTSS